MDAHLEHLLKLINAEADASGSRDELGRGPASDADMELLDAYFRAVVSVVIDGRRPFTDQTVSLCQR